MSLEDKLVLLSQVNEANVLDLTNDDVIFGEVSSDVTGRSVTKITAQPGSGYRGGVQLRYNRLDLGKLFGFFQPKLDVETGGTPTITWLVEKVKECYGISLLLDEITILRKSTEEGDFFVVEATGDSYQYSNSAEFKLEFDQIEIGTLLSASSQNYVYPTIQETQVAIDGLVYSGGWLIPEATPRLETLLVGTAVDDDLVWLTQTLSGDDWISAPNEVQDFNLADSHVEYNGPVAGFKPLADQSVTILYPPTATSVLAVRVSTNCKNLVGFLTFYY